MIDLGTSYLGLHLRNPVVPSASPLSLSLDALRRMEDAGAAAVVMHSLFEEQIEFESRDLDRRLHQGSESSAEALSYFPDLGHWNVGPDEYLGLIRNAKEALGIPVIGSLNGASTGGWIRYARLIEEAGADALELNIYMVPTDTSRTGADVERIVLDLVREVRGQIRIPLAVKLSPFLSSVPHMAAELDRAGAAALVLFNRFYQPDFDLEHLEVVPALTLSNPSELRLRLRFAAILFGRIRPDLAITGGVHNPEDVVKCMMAGARVAHMTSALLRHGVGHIARVLEGLLRWLEEHEYASIRQMQGSMSQQKCGAPAAFERANYMKALGSFDLRVI